jgi:hypothetical protein
MTEAQFCDALRSHYDANAYLVLPQVRNATGAARPVTRTADAIVVSLWPSRGLGAFGFEFKASRSDLLRELKEPAKANEIGRFCQEWWLCVGPDCTVNTGDLIPAAWGLMLVSNDGKVKVVKRAVHREPEPPTWAFVAAVLRAAKDCVTDEADVLRRISHAVNQAHDGEAERRRQAVERERKAWQTKAEEHALEVKAFEEASGVSWHSWAGRDKAKLGEAVRFVLEGGLASQVEGIRRVAQTCERIKIEAEAALAAGVMA